MNHFIWNDLIVDDKTIWQMNRFDRRFNISKTDLFVILIVRVDFTMGLNAMAW